MQKVFGGFLGVLCYFKDVVQASIHDVIKYLVAIGLHKRRSWLSGHTCISKCDQKDVHTYVVLMSFASKIICCNMNFSNHNKTETATLAKLFMHIAQLQIEW